MRFGFSLRCRLAAALSLFRLKPFDRTTEAGRSKERLRRAGLTTASATAAKAIAMLASLVTLPLTYRYLGPEQYGLWMVLLSIIGAMSFADLGIGLGLVNAIFEAHGKDDRELARTYITSAFGMLLGIAAVLAVAGAVAYPFVPWMRLFNVKLPTVAAEGAKAFLVLYAWFVINIPLDVPSRVHAALQRGYIPQILSMLASPITLLALLVVIALHGSLAWLVFGSITGMMVSAIVNAWVLFRDEPWLLPRLHAFRFAAAKKIIHLGLMFFALQCATVLGYTSDNIVITQVLGAAAVASYAVPQKLFSVVAIVLSMAITPLWPAYGEATTRGDVSWVRRTFFGSLWLALGISIPSCIFLALAGSWILRVFFGKSLHSPVLLLIALGLWGVISAVATSISVFLNGAGVLKEQAIIAIIASGFNLVLSITLARRFGVVGVCFGSIIAQLTIALPIGAVLVKRVFRDLQRCHGIGELHHLPVEK